MSYLFSPDRSLLRPQFETYRLHPLDPDTDISSYTLPGAGATQSRVGYNQHHLSFMEVRGRISWDHLAVGERGRGVYVDAEWGITGFVLGTDLQPTFTQLISLSTPISSSSAHPAEYPSVRPLGATTWAVSSGSGSLYILETTPPSDPTFSGDFIARYDLALPSSSEPCPFLLQAAHQVSPDEWRLLISRSVIPSDTGRLRSQTTAFELLEVVIDPRRRTSSDTSVGESLDVRWTLRGGDLPFWTSWSNEGWLVLSGEEYTASEDGSLVQPNMSSQPVEVGQANGVHDRGSEPLTASEKGDNNDSSQQDPYSWTQTPESLSVTVPFPAGTKRSDLDISMESDSFSLSLSSSSSITLSPPLSTFLANHMRHFWTDIAVASSTMTFDPAKSLLQLDLVKSEVNTRWPSIFTASDDRDDDDDDEVPETISASTIAAVRDAFNSIRTRQPGEPEGNHSAIPALLREEMDFDLEDGEGFGEGPESGLGDSGGGGKVGREVLVGYIKNGLASWSKAPTSILSTPLQTSGLIVKSAVDGLLCTSPASGQPSMTPWKHSGTSPALAFVLSSKKDLRAVRHITSARGSTVLAFDAGSSSTAAGNMYVYYPPISATTAKQGVVRISGAERGALLGVGAVEVEEKNVVVALCEKELVVLHGVL